MRKILMFATLAIVFSIHGYIIGISSSQKVPTGIINSQKTTAAAPAEMISNGTFDSETGWALTAPWSIGSGVASFDNSSTNGMTQTSGDMISPIVANTNYTLEFDVVSAGAAYISFYSTTYQAYVGGAGYTTGHKTINFTSPADVGSAGFFVYANNDVAFTIDNISLTLND